MVKRLGNSSTSSTEDMDTRQQERELSIWYQSALGQKLLEHEQRLVARAISGRFGASMAQIDSGFHYPLFEKRLFGLGAVVSQLENRAPCPVVCAKPEDLPFEPESLDMVLMHHTLDICRNPYQAVRECATALKPGGVLIILGFNPYSIWRLKSFFLSKAFRRGVWQSRFIRSGRVEDWMQLLNFELERHEKHVFFGPSVRPQWLQKLRLGERVQRRILPFSGAVYLLVGYKQVLGRVASPDRKLKHGMLESVVSMNPTRIGS